MKSEVVILIGNTGSGKTTIAKKYAEKEYVVVSADGLRYSLGAGTCIFIPKYEKMVWKVVFIIFEDLLKLGVNIVIDATNLTKWYRKKYLNILQKYDYTKIALVLPKISKEESINRRMNDPHGKEDRNVWEDIWTRFDLSYEEPTKEEGFDEIIYLGV